MSLLARSSRCQKKILLLAAIPILIATWVWFSALAFIPVPWPDDSAFYFVAKELFRWPPRWVMLPQAPFEPTYRIFNFNTMPLYPILIGLGRKVGIDGSFLLKFWPLTAWALSGSLLVTALYRKGLPFLLSGLLAFIFALDPELQWGSVLLRPESLIGLVGLALILGLTLGFPKKLQPTRFWDPVAALLALGAYAHFNAIHLVIPVVLAFALGPTRDWIRLVRIGAKTSLYLSPWILLVLFHWKLFILQMDLQWTRLAVPNDWLSSVPKAIHSLFQEMGNPVPWPPLLMWAATGIWLILFISQAFALGVPAIEWAYSKWASQGPVQVLRKKSRKPFENRSSKNEAMNLLPALGWVWGAFWLWHTKPEVWFLYYCHSAVWCWVGLLLLKLWKLSKTRSKARTLALALLISSTAGITFIFGYVDVIQESRMSSSQSWNWPTYSDYIDCIDRELVQLQNQLEPGRPFRVWNPTFPDVLVELSRRHADWEFTRTNDFSTHVELALQHGRSVEAMVVTETLNWEERTVSAKPEQVPEIHSLWMNWNAYFLSRFLSEKDWKPNRFICQRGRWQAFIYMIDPKIQTEN